MRHFLKILTTATLLLSACGTQENSQVQSESRPALDACSALVGSCEYYACVEKERIACGETGYPLGYGLNYCTKLSALTFSPSRTDLGRKTFPADGNQWKNEVRTCLQEEMEDFFASGAEVSCESLRSFAFDSHPRCYTKATSFCGLNVQSVVKVGLTIAPKDLLTAESQKQVRDTAQICDQQLGARLTTERNLLVRFQLLRYQAIWKMIANAPSNISEWLGSLDSSQTEEP